MKEYLFKVMNYLNQPDLLAQQQQHFIPQKQNIQPEIKKVLQSVPNQVLLQSCECYEVTFYLPNERRIPKRSDSSKILIAKDKNLNCPYVVRLFFMYEDSPNEVLCRYLQPDTDQQQRTRSMQKLYTNKLHALITSCYPTVNNNHKIGNFVWNQNYFKSNYSLLSF